MSETELIKKIVAKNCADLAAIPCMTDKDGQPIADNHPINEMMASINNMGIVANAFGLQIREHVNFDNDDMEIWFGGKKVAIINPEKSTSETWRDREPLL